MLAQQKKKPAVVYQDVHQLYILHKCITSHEMWKLNYRKSYDEKMKFLCILQMNKVSKLKTKSKKHNTKPRKNSVPIVE